jgi:hypothetical protein
MNSLPADHTTSESNDSSATPVVNDLRNPLWIIAIGMACFFGAAVAVMALVAGCATQPTAPDIPPVIESSSSPAQASPGVLLDVSQSREELDRLVAPIALYPDELVAQVLAAATYPAEVVEAERWMQAHPELKGDALAKAADTQPWDNSVKALVQFPPVLAMMDQNLSWTSSLGEAYTSDSQAVMGAVQQMRAQARRAGNLQSTPQQNVTDEGQTIVIEPAEPDIVYVPEYDPWLVYGEPLAFYPGWVAFPGLFFDGPGVYFGLGIGIGLFGGYGWGWHHWGADWHGHGIVYNHSPYVSHSPTFRGHRGSGGFGYPGGFAHGVGAAPGLNRGGFAGSGGFHSGTIPGGGVYGTHSGAFSGFNHGGATQGFAARGRASAGGFHGGGFAGFGAAGGHR